MSDHDETSELAPAPVVVTVPETAPLPEAAPSLDAAPSLGASPSLGAPPVKPPARRLMSGVPISPASFGRLVLVLVGLVWFVIGLFSLADPVALADMVDFKLRNNLARLEIRAMYGGFCVAIGVVHFLATTRAAWLLPALSATGICTVGLVSGRLLSIAIDGFSRPFALMLMLIASELALCAVVALAVWRLMVAARSARRAAS
jgi:hypothetical protein